MVAAPFFWIKHYGLSQTAAALSLNPSPKERDLKFTSSLNPFSQGRRDFECGSRIAPSHLGEGWGEVIKLREILGEIGRHCECTHEAILYSGSWIQ